MPKSLLIVESPAKAKTIKSYLSKDFSVESSYGHIRDLSKEEMGIDIQNNFTPRYIIIEDKKAVIRALKKSAKAAQNIYLATDGDREGEAISWHLIEALNLKESTHRIVFQEITKKSIQEALAKPRRINQALVEAQQARRILDRIVGFEISPVLWQKIKGGLSAGRVQSVAVRCIVEREREVNHFKRTSFFSAKAQFSFKEQVFEAQLSEKLPTEEGAKHLLRTCKGIDFYVDKVEHKPLQRKPSPPFTTSSLQQEASRVMGFAVAQTMRLAQQLYESGRISYMRTDSVSLSEEALASAAASITQQFGEEYVNIRQYKTKIRNAQEAHEAIRPTDFSKVPNKDQSTLLERLYALIWKRALASQMANAQIARTVLHISGKELDKKFLATGDIVKFDGFLRLYHEAKEENEETQPLPKVEAGDALELVYMQAKQSFTKPPPRYTEATLVRLLEEKGIGRPSTYAPTIETIQKRNYVSKESREGTKQPLIAWELKANELKRMELSYYAGAEKKKLFPTDTGIIVNDFLLQHFPNILDYSFTADIEEKLDHIALGEQAWVEMLRHFYDQFHPQIEKTRAIERKDVQKERLLGKDPETQEEVFVRTGRFGPYVQLGKWEEGQTEKPPRASLRKNQLMENIDLDEALELFKLPRHLGEFENEEVITSEGKFGPYVLHKKKFYSLKKEQLDPLNISLEESIRVIESARAFERSRIIKTFTENADVQVLNGRYGPYIKFGDKNVRIPKEREPKELSYEECEALAAKTKSKSSYKRR